MLKSIFFTVVALNVIVFFCAAERFLITLASPNIVGECKAGALTQVAHEASNSMQNLLIPGAFWLAATALVNLAIAGAVIFRKAKAI